MSQHDFEIANQGFPAFRSDLNNGLQALASNSAGATAPSTTYAYQMWYDSTANLLKMRNADDDAWITLAYFDQTNDEWEVRSAVIQAVDSAGVVIKTDDGVTRVTVADNGNVTIANDLTITGELVKSGAAHVFNRTSSDGDIVSFEKDGSTVGLIGSSAGVYINMGSGDTGFSFNPAVDGLLPHNPTTNAQRDAAIDLGFSSVRWKDLYLSGGVYLGGTGSANKLTDYEEGVHVATIGCSSGGSITLDSADQELRYTKIGNIVHVTGLLGVASVSSPAGSFTISLPFAAINQGGGGIGYFPAAIVAPNGLSTGNISDFYAQGNNNQSIIRVFFGNSTSVLSNSANAVQASTNFRVSITYETSA